MKKERFTKASRPFFFARLSQIFLQRCIHRAGAGSKFLKVVLHQIGKADSEEVYAPDAFIGKKSIDVYKRQGFCTALFTHFPPVNLAHRL